MRGVTVVIPCYNGAQYLAEAIGSVLKQDYAGPVEILVGNDGSTDASAEVAASFDGAVQILYHPGRVNRGLPATRNLCIRAASHPLVAFLDADDIWLPTHLSRLVPLLENHPTAALAYDNAAYLLENGDVFGTRLPADHRPATAEDLLLDNCLFPGSIILRKSVFDESGTFDETLRYAEDHDMWLRVLERSCAVYTSVIGSLYRMHPDQMTKKPDVLWRYAARVLEKARARHPYPRRCLRKRAAVISYRLGEAALSQHQPFRGCAHMAKAALLDPVRATRELGNRLRRTYSRYASGVRRGPQGTDRPVPMDSLERSEQPVSHKVT
jgi:glycosyltransferase involved in cell wall biosynthesis